MQEGSVEVQCRVVFFEVTCQLLHRGCELPSHEMQEVVQDKAFALRRVQLWETQFCVVVFVAAELMQFADTIEILTVGFDQNCVDVLFVSGAQFRAIHLQQ